MPNVVELHQFNTAVEFAHDWSGYPAPALVDTRTSVETEQLWKNRLHMYVRSETMLLKVNRLRKLTAVFTVASLGTLIFSLYMAPTLPPAVFFALFVTMAFGVITYPAWLLIGKDSRNRRDAISRRFYQSNHELDIQGNKVTLINRANYAYVTHVNVTDNHIGQFSRK